ncbi:hypothetical protein ACFZB6_26735 [Streptomyces syringium]|uniref:hypothetical protein n=1 Tax=Streptomyces syringium TaxID=76729 RepID=UPI0036ED4119
MNTAKRALVALALAGAALSFSGPAQAAPSQDRADVSVLTSSSDRIVDFNGTKEIALKLQTTVKSFVFQASEGGYHKLHND